MSPTDYPLSLYRGDSYAWQFHVWTDPAGTVPADLTGVAVAAEIRNEPGGAVIVVLPCTLTGNVIDMVLSAADCARVPNKGQWDLQLTFPSGTVKTIVAGRTSARADIVGSTRSIAA